MKKHRLSGFLPVVCSLLVACGSGKGTNESGEKKELPYEDDSYTSEYRDTVRLNDELTLIQLSKLSPANAAFDVYDLSGRKRLTGGSCSESDRAYVIRYDYNTEGVLAGFSDGYLPVNIADTLSCRLLSAFLSGSDILTYRFSGEEETVGVENRYVFTYAGRNRLVAVSDPERGNRLEAPTGYSLEWAIRPDSIFWHSDLDGGNYHLLFSIRPDAASKDSTRTATYIGYHLCSAPPSLASAL